MLALALVACKKESPVGSPAPTPVATTTTGTPATGAAAAARPDGVRKVAIEAGTEGYKPERIAGKPGEKLMLVFTRTAEASCISQLKTPDGKLVDLPKGTPVEVAVTVPQSGELGFACGMDMFHGVVVAEKS